MAHPLSGYRWSVVALVLAGAAALAAEVLSRGTGATTSRTRNAPAELDSLLPPVRGAVGSTGSQVRVSSDPFSPRQNTTPAATGIVAPRGGLSTVSSSGRTRRLTAILTVDQRAIAVIDETIVKVGDRLPDGSRVDVIQSD